LPILRIGPLCCAIWTYSESGEGYADEDQCQLALPLGAYGSGADPAVQALAARASTGDKQAQLDLGIRFEEGAGVARDLDTAKKLYRQAASDSGGTIWIYTPPVGNGTSGRVVPITKGEKSLGLAEAKKRFEKVNQALRLEILND